MRHIDIDMLDGYDHRLRALRDKAHRGQWRLEDGIDWSIAAKPPSLFMKHFAGRAVGALIAGENATAGACNLLIDRLPPSIARDCLELQTADEDRHARAYAGFLERIGLDPQPHERLSIAVDRLMNWSGPPAGLIFAVHVVLESEALVIQQDLGGDMDCPLFSAINQRVTQDEARHVAFGRLTARRAAAEMDDTERRRTLDEIASIWTACTKALTAHNFVLWRALSIYADRGWQQQLASMEELGLRVSQT